MNYTVPYEPADIVIHVPGKGIVLKEKSLIAIQKADNKIVALGAEVERMAEGELRNVEVLSPLRQGMIADFPAAEALFSILLTKALGRKGVLKPALVACVPKGITIVEKKALEDALLWGKRRAKEVLILEAAAEEFIREFYEKSPKIYQKYKAIIEITKYEPARYVEEQLRNVLTFAAQAGISPKEMNVLLQKCSAGDS